MTEKWVDCLSVEYIPQLVVSCVCPPPCQTCGPLSCHEKLALYEARYDELLLTRQVVSINDGDRSVQYDYSPASLQAIKAERDALRLECGPTGRRMRPGFIHLGAPSEGHC